MEAEVQVIKSHSRTIIKKPRGSHKYFMDVTKRCTTEWKRIEELTAKDTQRSVSCAEAQVHLVIAADYQMCKLVPYWGLSPQPGSTYSLQKLNHDVFGIVNHATTKSTVYLCDERYGPKNTDHTLSYITHYLSGLPKFVRRLHLFLDNTSSTNKNWYTMAWAMEMIIARKNGFHPSLVPDCWPY